MNEEVPVYEAKMYSDGIYLKVPQTKEGLELAKFLLNHFEKEFKKKLSLLEHNDNNKQSGRVDKNE